MARIMALDIGTKYIGVAISDETQTIAAFSDVLIADTEQQLLSGIKQFIAQYMVDTIIVGLPLNMNGSKGSSAQKALDFAERLKEATQVDILTFDERLTTKQGQDMLLEADMSRKKRKSKIDSIAASIILQTYLDSKKNRW